MPTLSDAEQADRLSRRRARMMVPLALMFVLQQGTFFSERANDHRLVSWVHTSGWVILATVLLVGLTTGGFWLRSREIRALVEDEVTRENRHRALSLGFVLAMAAAIALFVLDRFEPMDGATAIHLILSIGLGAALVRFSALERRALG